eukprot:scaffold48_cov311-Pinguiococcus_pyrenoidosus.AAC.304
MSFLQELRGHSTSVVLDLRTRLGAGNFHSPRRPAHWLLMRVLRLTSLDSALSHVVSVQRTTTAPRLQPMSTSERPPADFSKAFSWRSEVRIPLSAVQCCLPPFHPRLSRVSTRLPRQLRCASTAPQLDGRFVLTRGRVVLCSGAEGARRSSSPLP